MPATVEAIEELYRSRYASYRGGVAALTGYDAARDVVQEAFAQGYPRGGVMHLFPSLRSLRGYPPYQELLTPKE